MSHGTTSSTQINLNDPAYAYAKNNPYIVGLLNAGWRWGTAGHTDGSETQVVHFSYEGGNWTIDQELFVERAAATWANVANIQFAFEYENDDAEILFHNTTTGAIAHYSGWSGTPNQALMENNNVTVKDIQDASKFSPSTFQVADLGRVDTYFPSDASDFTSAPSSTDWGLNSAAFIDMIHEIGHALGLKHPHDGGTVTPAAPKFPGVKNQNDTGTDGVNTDINTIMSYVHPDPTFKKFPGSPMALDVAAIQVLYGANTTYNSGNDTYVIHDPAFLHNSDQWGQAGKEFQCIWDTGGTDQIEYDGSRNARIDLRPATLTQVAHRAGYFSYVDGTHITAGFVIAGDITNALADQNGVTGVIIENATGGSGDDWLYGNDVNNHLEGNGGADILRGYGGGDVLHGGAAHDALYGAKGDDTYILDDLTNGKYDSVSELSGDGRDTVIVQQISGSGVNSYTLTSGIEVGILLGTGNGFTLEGNSLDNFLQGSSFNDTLFGAGGDDTLNGDHGFDRLKGGTGNDTYVLNYVDPTTGTYSTALEGMHSGTDTVEVREDPTSSVASYTLGAYMENGKILGNQGFELDGNSYNNKLWGGTGGDVLKGGFGNDQFYGNDDALNSGDDFDAHTSVNAPDDFYGGVGDDIYYLYEAAISNYGYSIVHEEDGEGTDTVHVMLAFNGSFVADSYTMTDNVEIGIVDMPEHYDSLPGFHLTGNSIDNTLTGNFAQDELEGRGGNDILDGKGGYDTLVGSYGDDEYHLADANLVDGTWVFDDVVETDPGFEGGIDTVLIQAASTSFALLVLADYTLTDNVEDGIITSSIGFQLIGNELDNELTGNSGDDELIGQDGRDTLTGLGGGDLLNGGGNQDILIGGGSKDFLIGGDDGDTFVYESVADSRAGVRFRDVIEDFDNASVEGRDVIDLSAIDANTRTPGNQKFKFIGTSGFGSHGDHHAYGQLRVSTVHGGEGDYSVLQADVNGDGKADFEIQFNRVVDFTQDDFRL